MYPRVNPHKYHQPEVKDMKKILIVDDEDMNVELFVQLLEDDYKLLIARDGQQGLEMAQQDMPDLILMDMAMPVMDGWEATRRIKSDQELRNIPVIGVSSHAMVGDAEKAMEAGCDAYLTKPVDEDELFNKLKEYLSD